MVQSYGFFCVYQNFGVILCDFCNNHFMKHTSLWVFGLCLWCSTALFAQNEMYVRCIAFYNLENLFDTIHDEGKNDYEYLSDGGMK